MPKKNKSDMDEKIEISPLLSRSENESKGLKKTFSTDLASPFHSTVNAEKFDMKRFSDRRDEEESSFKIVLYVILVIIVGVGLALFVRNVISNNEDATNDNTPTEEDANTDEEEEVSNVSINTNEKSDSLALSSQAENFVFTRNETLSLGNESSNTAITADKAAYEAYSTFSQVSIEFAEGVTLETMPKIDLNYSEANKQIKIALPENANVHEDLSESIIINHDIKSISFNTVSKTFTLSLSNAADYRAALITVGDTVTLIVDVKVVEEEVEETPEEPEETEDQPEEVVDPVPNGSVNYTNEFSKNKQSIVSKVTTNSVVLNETYYTETIEFFELAWGSQNNVGEQFIPNATAELVKENGISYIDVTLNNLSEFQFQTIQANQINLDLSQSNFLGAQLVSFNNGVAKVRISIKAEADFRLVSETTVGGLTQVVAIQIKRP